MKKLIRFIPFIIFIFGFSKEIEMMNQKKMNVEENYSANIFLGNAQAIVLVDDENILNSNNFDGTQGVVIIGVKIPGKSENLTQDLERVFIQRAITEEKIYRLKKMIVDFFQNNGRKDVTVEIPVQNLSKGIIKVVVNDNTQEESPIDQEKIIAPSIKAIVLAQNVERFNTQSFNDAEGVLILELDIPGKEINLNDKLNSLFINRVLTKDTLFDIKHEILLYYKKNDRPIVDVYIPPQNVTNGVLRVVVIDAKVDEIKVSGNKYFKNKQFLKYISLKPGDTISEKKLLKDVNFLNRNPFRNVDVVYAPGRYPDTTDIDLYVREIRPVRAFYGADNTGLDLIGKERFHTGIHFGNLFWQSHVLSYQLTKSYRPHAFEAHTLQYTIPLPWKHLIFLLGGYSKVSPDVPRAESATSKGKSGQGSIRYDIPLTPYNFIIHDLILGFDFKRTNNSAEFSERHDTFGKNANLTQLVLSYESNYQRGNLQISLELGVYWSPGEWLPDQSNTTYQTLRPHAEHNYIYGTAVLSWLARLYKDFTWSTLIRTQFSNRNLLASEQFGLGGYNSVRGYDEHQINGDSGVLISSEIRTPDFGIFHYLFSRKIPDHFQILGFIDYGKAWRDKREQDVSKSQHIWSVGPGIRYVIDPFLSLRLDYGYKMKRKNYPGGKKKLHFGVNMSF